MYSARRHHLSYMYRWPSKIHSHYANTYSTSLPQPLWDPPLRSLGSSRPSNQDFFTCGIVYRELPDVKAMMFNLKGERIDAASDAFENWTAVATIAWHRFHEALSWGCVVLCYIVTHDVSVVVMNRRGWSVVIPIRCSISLPKRRNRVYESCNPPFRSFPQCRIKPPFLSTIPIYIIMPSF